MFAKPGGQLDPPPVNSDEDEELYSDCLEQFVDDRSNMNGDRSDLSGQTITNQATNSNDTKKAANYKPELLSTVIEEELDNIDRPLESDEVAKSDEPPANKDLSQCANEASSEGGDQNDDRKQRTDAATTAQITPTYNEATKLRVKVAEVVEGSHHVQQQQVDCGHCEQSDDSSQQVASETNNQNTVNDSSNNSSNKSSESSQPSNGWAVHEEQVIEKFENFVKPNKQGDQVSPTQPVRSSAHSSASPVQTAVNDTRSDTLKEAAKFKESSTHCVNSLRQTAQQCSPPLPSFRSSAATLVSKSESPSIHFEQRVSVVKHTFENKVKSMMSSDCDRPAASDKQPRSDKQLRSDKASGQPGEASKMNGLQQKKLEQISQLESAATKSQCKDRKATDEDSTESKIAREIRELKEREEELRRMRLERSLNNRQTGSSTVASPINCLNNCAKNCQPNGYLSSSNSSADSTISLNQSEKTSDKSSDRSSDKSSVRSNSPPVSTDPCSASIDSLDEGFAEFKSPNSTKNQSTDLLSPPSQATLNASNVLNNGSNLNKILATTRIQQEIEEQTRRELALKAAGSIKTISQERTDKLMMSNLLGSNLSNANSILSPTLSLSSLASSLSSLNIPSNNPSISNPTSDLATSCSSSSTSTPIANGAPSKFTNSFHKAAGSTATNHNLFQSNAAKTKTNLYTKNSGPGLLKHRTFSTSHLNNLNSSPVAPFKMNQSGRHISMAKFFATKGKSAIVDYSSGGGQFNGGSAMHSDLNYHSYTDLLRPPKPDPITAHKKCIQSADFKIASELKDLHEREQELR